MRLKLSSAIVAMLVACYAMSAQSLPNPTSSSFRSTLTTLMKAIPDHECVLESARPYFCDDLYLAMLKAWNIPGVSEALGEIGDEEFLYYFVSGQEGAPLWSTLKWQVLNYYESFDQCKLDVTYEIGEKGQGSFGTRTMKLTLRGKNGRWAIYDFDDTRTALFAYLYVNIHDYKTGKSVKDIRQIMSEAGFSQSEMNETIQSFVSSWDKFFQEFPDEK